ncbi:Na/Pi cotransporter family protein [Bacteroidota bacterium]
MNYSIIEFLTLIGSLGFFLFGMKLMSEALQKVAGDKMRNILSAMTSNRIKGVFTGFLITAIIQSSSATTVMVVSFVNAGLLSLIQSIGVIMGANIGTTVTAWLITLLGFKVNVSVLALPIIGIGLPFIFSKVDIRKSWGEFMVGFAIIFMGLQFLKTSVPDIKSNPEILAFLQHYTDLGFLSTLLFLGVGTLLTVIIQSSSATMALTLVMCNNGWIPFDIATAIVLGENIGTTITANLAALVANVSAKRAAIAHLLFNVFGVFWILIIFKHFLNGIDWIVTSSGGGSPFSNPFAIPVALSIFHTLFNVINTIILIGLATYITKIAIKIISQKEDSEEEFTLKYINTGLLSTSELSLLQAKKEIILYVERIQRMFLFVRKLLIEEKTKKFHKGFTKIEKLEEISDKYEVDIANYLAKISTGEMSKHGSYKVQAYLKVINDIESISDCNYNLAKTIIRKQKKKAEFTMEMINNINKMFDLVEKGLNMMYYNINDSSDTLKITETREIEDKINNLRDTYKKEHLKNVEKNKYSYITGVVYNDIVCETEKLADYIINITESLEEIDEKLPVKNVI